MFTRILLPTDGSELSQTAVGQAIQFAKALGARITAVSVVPECRLALVDEGFAVPDIAAIEEKVHAIEVKRANAILDKVRDQASRAGVDCDVVAPVSDTPYLAIIEQAEKSHSDVIVMASHGRRGLAGLLLGSETVRVLTHSKIPVLVCR